MIRGRELCIERESEDIEVCDSEAINQGFGLGPVSQTVPRGCLMDSPGTDFEVRIAADEEGFGYDDLAGNGLLFRKDFSTSSPTGPLLGEGFEDEDELHQNWGSNYDNRIFAQE